jgi:hypothetical protein
MTNTTLLDPAASADAPGEMLAAARERKAAALEAERDLFVLAIEWVAMHSADSLGDAATWQWPPGGDGPCLIAGPGAPLVSEFCIPEFAAALGMTHDSGKAYLGDAIEVRHRLPGLWALVVQGHVPVWQARRVAQQTVSLSAPAAGFVDRHLTPVAAKIGPAQLERLVEEARVRFDPEDAERRRIEATERRRMDVHADQVGFDGTVAVDGCLDLADALDLDAALRVGAQKLADLGCTESLDVRRSMAAGELARTQLALDLATGPAASTSPGSGPRRWRDLNLYVHLSEAALRGVTGELARVENTRTFVSPDQVATWCGLPGTRVVVRPVIDLTGHVHTDAVEVTGRLRDRGAVQHLTCVFPRCSRPARRCDFDHTTPRNKGGPGCQCNTAPLCRRHHRLKTHGGWTYTKVDATSFVWTSPYGYLYLRDHTGTTDLTPDRPA